MKQFDCQKMPEEVKDALMECAPEEWNKGSYQEWFVEKEEEGEDYINIVNHWLMSQGCKEGEKVLIKFWW